MLTKLGRYAGKAAPTAIALVLIAGFAHATVPDSSGVIHGCYAKSGGALRVIDTAKPTQKCTTKQVPLSWNANGSVIAARLRWAGSAVTGQDPSTGFAVGTWTQHAGETDTILPGVATVTVDPGCAVYDLALSIEISGYEDSHGPFVTTYDLRGDGLSPGTYDVLLNVPEPESAATTGSDSLTLFEPASNTPRTMTATVDGGSNCSTGLHVSAVSFDVEAIR